MSLNLNLTSYRYKISAVNCLYLCRNESANALESRARLPEDLSFSSDLVPPARVGHNQAEIRHGCGVAQDTLTSFWVRWADIFSPISALLRVTSFSPTTWLNKNKHYKARIDWIFFQIWKAAWRGSILHYMIWRILLPFFIQYCTWVKKCNYL